MAVFVESFFDFLEPDTFSVAAVLFIAGFIVWELPRSIRIMDEEYTKDIYPEMGRVFDFIIFLIGLGSLAFLYFMDGLSEIVDFLRHETFMVVFIIILLAIPLLITLGYLKRFLGRVDKHESITVFIVHSLLDLAHTVFFICFSIIFVPIVLYLSFGWL